MNEKQDKFSPLNSPKLTSENFTRQFLCKIWSATLLRCHEIKKTRTHGSSSKSWKCAAGKALTARSWWNMPPAFLQLGPRRTRREWRNSFWGKEILEGDRLPVVLNSSLDPLGKNYSMRISRKFKIKSEPRTHSNLQRQIEQVRQPPGRCRSLDGTKK